MRPLLIGHRGAPRERPENTLPSFLRALELGADGVELDVHATRDSVVVVHHDATVRAPSRDAGAQRAIADLDWGELQSLELQADARVPTLDEVLAAVADRADVYVEIKGRGIEARVVEVIARSPAPARCAVHSFDHRAVKRSLGMAAGLRGGVLLSSYLIDSVAALRAAGARDLWMQWEFVDGPLVEAVHDAGGRIVAWTVNSVNAARTLAAWGVDAICSDDVPPIREMLASLR